MQANGLISESYRDLNSALHESNDSYGAGVSTKKWYPAVTQFAHVIGAHAMLDYGSGKGAMGKALSHLMVVNYDPSVEDFNETPDPTDLVVSLDVLEHIEPECIENVLDDIHRCARKGVFLTINMLPAEKTLADGRNAHILQRPIEWWLPRLMQRWQLINVSQMGVDEFVFTGIPHTKKKNGA
jgi:hypothetical protein